MNVPQGRSNPYGSLELKSLWLALWMAGYHVGTGGMSLLVYKSCLRLSSYLFVGQLTKPNIKVRISAEREIH